MTSMPHARARAAATVALAAPLLLATVLLAPPAAAAGLECTWTGAGGDANWSTAGNWSDCAGGAPGADDIVVFDGTAMVHDTANDLGAVTLAEVRFGDAALTVTGDDITTELLTVSAPTVLGASLVVDTVGGTQTHSIAADLTVTAPGILRLQQGAGATDVLALANGATVAADLAGGSETLELTGTGSLEPAGMTYDGALRVLGDVTLRCGGLDCGGPGAEVLVDGSGSIEFTADTQFVRDIRLGTTGVLGPHSLVAGPHAITLEGQVTLGAYVHVRGGTTDPLIFEGGLSIGDGVLALDGAAEVPAFATLTSNPNGEIHVGTVYGPASFAIQEGQLGHEGWTAVNGVDSLLVVNDSLALGPVGSSITTAYDGATIGTEDTITLDEDIRLGDFSVLATLAPAASLTATDVQLSAGGRVETRATPSSVVLVGVHGEGPLHLASADASAPIIFGDAAPSTYTGETVAETGAVQLNAQVSIPGDFTIVDADVTTLHTVAGDLHDLIADTSAVNLTGAGSLVINDNEWIGSLGGGSGTVHLVDQPSGLWIAGSATTTYAGAFRGHGTLAHIGSGVLTLTGDWVDFASDSQLAATDGVVQVDGSMPETLATVKATLRGTGTVGSLLIDGGTVAAGTSPGCLNVVDDLTGSGTIEVELGGYTPCGAYDRIVTDVQQLGAVDWQISFVGGFVPAVGDEFPIVTTTGAGNNALPTEQFVVDGVTVEVVWDGADVLVRILAVPAQPALASTGVSVWPIAAVAGVALLVGLALFAATRARRRAERG
jgi:hypothetical protein